MNTIVIDRNMRKRICKKRFREAKIMENNKNDEITKVATRYLFILLFQRITGIGLFFVAGGTFNYIRGIVNISLYFVVSLIACILMFSGHKETLSERGKKQDNTKNWDKILLPIYFVLAYYVIYIIAGLGNRFHWKTLPMEYFYIGIIFYLVSCVFIIWPILENKHFEATSRIQDNKENEKRSIGNNRYSK
jgi:hypothetical protein